ncbi:hypothetical protein [Blastococcus atacamensis]|uniref:hypothetical protein n=1 Tax=Blastococcus atacamensis TaxID=2070508 RepID=UPI000CEC2D69|nr:hypothetical protein [Blastococcus atacamensis]
MSTLSPTAPTDASAADADDAAAHDPDVVDQDVGPAVRGRHECGRGVRRGDVPRDRHQREVAVLGDQLVDPVPRDVGGDDTRPLAGQPHAVERPIPVRRQ